MHAMRYKRKSDLDMLYGYFLNLTYDLSIDKQQSHVALVFIKIDR